MTVSVWRVAVEAPADAANDLSGEGARITGGRRNAPGTPVVYCASSIALAALETVAQVRGNPLPLNRFLVKIAIPAEVWDSRTAPEHLPGGWDALPVGPTGVRAGARWIAAGESAIMTVPSVLVPDEPVCLIDPVHPDTRRIEATAVRKRHHDPRFF